MRFVEDMLASMIRESTGFNSKRLLRKIGGKRILMMGGAAVAGALLQQKMGPGQGGSPGSAVGTAPSAANPPVPPPPVAVPPPAVPPGAVPPPPPPAAAVPPPPPPMPAAAEPPALDLPLEMAYATVRTMVAAALADGHLAPEEKRVIEQRLGAGVLTPEQTAQVHRDLVVPARPAELAAMVATDGDREMLFEVAVLVLRADQAVPEFEKRWLRAFGDALGFDAARQERLQSELFA